MASYYGPGSGSSAPAGYTGGYRPSAFLDPSYYGSINQQGLVFGQPVANVAGVGMFTLSQDPNDPLRQYLGGRLPGEAPNRAFANQFLSSLGGGAPGASGAAASFGGGSLPAGAAPTQFPTSGAGGAPFGAVGPDQLSGLFGNSQGEQRAKLASQLAFQEYERMPGLYQSDMANQVGGAIERQLSGQDAPFTPETIDRMRARIGSQAGAADAARQRMIGDQAAGRGLGGGGMELGLRLASQEQGAKQRAMEGNQLDITSALENFASQERGRQAGQGFLQEQLAALQPATLAKGQALANYQNFGDPLAGLRGLFAPTPPQSGPGFNPATGGYSVSRMGSPFTTVTGGVTGYQGAPMPQSQNDYLQKAMAFLGLGGGGIAKQAQQAQQYSSPLIGTPGAPNPYSGIYQPGAAPPPAANPYLGYY